MKNRVQPPKLCGRVRAPVTPLLHCNDTAMIRGAVQRGRIHPMPKGESAHPMTRIATANGHGIYSKLC